MTNLFEADQFLFQLTWTPFESKAYPISVLIKYFRLCQSWCGRYSTSVHLTVKVVFKIQNR